MARTFNGSTDQIFIGDPAVVQTPSPFTVWAWMYPTGYPVTSPRLYEKGWHGFYVVNNGSFGMFVSHDIAGTPNGADASAVASTIALNQWWFVAGKFVPGTGGSRLYVGSETATVAEVTYATRNAESGPREPDTGFTLWIGRGEVGDHFQGRIGPTGMTKTDLSAAQLEVIRRFTYTARGRHVWAGLRMMNEASGDIRDYSGNGNTGVVTGTTWIKGPRHTVRPQVA